MDYKERTAQFCDKQCGDRNECEYKACNKTFRCDYLSGIMYGWELGQTDAFEKISEWLEDFCNEHYIMSYSDSHEVDNSELIEIFKKKMKD